MEHDSALPPLDRRGFTKRAVAFGLGALAVVPPFGAGLSLLLDPLRRHSGKTTAVPVTSVGALPEDGTPRKFPIVTDRTDAWNRTANVPIGAVYLRRVQGKVQALNVACPHAGCFVNYEPARKGYFCPCHNSTFAVDGSLQDPRSPSPRAMDDLEVEIRNQTEVWVRFQNFRAGVAVKIPVA